MPGSIAQYSSLQVCGGQSGQLLPCGQLSPELKDELLLELMDELEGKIKAASGLLPTEPTIDLED